MNPTPEQVETITLAVAELLRRARKQAHHSPAPGEVKRIIAQTGTGVEYRTED